MKRGNYNRSQISIFIIIAIIIIAVIVLFLLIRVSPIKQSVSPEIQLIYSYYENCIKNTGEQAIYAIGWSGGYYTLPNYSTENSIAYYYYLGKNYAPSKNFIESELSKYMDSMLIYCSNDLSQFQDFDINVGVPVVKTSIEKGKIIFNTNYPLGISKGDKSYFFDKFDIIIDSRLGEIYDFSINITKQQIKDKRKICISCINQQANERNFYVELNDYDKKTTIFTVVDKKYKIMDNDFRFNFAARYDV